MSSNRAVSNDQIASIPIVGVGASAGGLEALELLLRFLPPSPGLALIVVQHLDPTRKGMIVELLQRATPMKVLQVKEGTSVQADHVYVIPPNKDLAIVQGVLHLIAPTEPRGRRLAIDGFFRSLAQDQRERAIGVVLSGMGSDGTQGLKAIKEAGGTAFVQALESAQFDSMPRSVIEAGLADVVAPAEELGKELMAHLGAGEQSSRPELAGKTRSALSQIFILLRTQSGHDFSSYKKSTVLRRIERRMAVRGLKDVPAYARFLQANAQETELLVKELLIGVTSFFRDPEAWDVMRDNALPQLLSDRRAGSTIRAWVPACSTGEEAYSLAIIFHEAVGRCASAPGFPLQVFASDLDKDAVERARRGVYPAAALNAMSPERLKRFFVQVGDGYRVSKLIRESVVFAQQNLVMDPPFTRMDIVSCRNLLIYLAPELQKKVLSLFHYSLRPGGLLFLGSAESASATPSFFEQLSGPSRIYRRTEQLSMQPTDLAGVFFRARGREAASAGAYVAAPGPNLQQVAERLVLNRFAPPSVLTNDKGDILFITGRTGKYLEPATGKLNWNVFAMAREGLSHELGAAFRKASRDHVAVVTRALLPTEEGRQVVEVKVEPILEPEALRGTFVFVFVDLESPPAVPLTRRRRNKQPAEATIAELEQELKRARQDARTTFEEMQSSLEELTSSNEELQSTNEELQSTNEELTTSKEELQSLNEEMQTLNSELQAKVEELNRAECDMRNLLDSTEIATLFLDRELKIRRFTSHMTRLVRLIQGDIGRPITDLACDLVYPEMADDTREVLRTLRSSQRSIASGDGRWFEVRILPYRTSADLIDGVVITFADITVAKNLEATLRARAER